MSDLREMMAEEAVKRMKALKLYDEKENSIVEAFLRDGSVFVSKPVFVGKKAIGIFHECTDAEKKLIKKAEDDYGILVYHVIRNNTEFGTVYSMLYVSEHQDEWEYDMEDITGDPMYPIAYVANVGMDVPEDADTLVPDESMSEFGSIGISSTFGGLIRTA